MAIVANHAHLMPSNDGTGWWPEGDADMLIEHLDYCGIEKVVIFPPFSCQMDGDMKKANVWALDQVAKHSDRFIAAGTLNPAAENVFEVLEILYDEGVRLIKIHPSIDKHDIADPKLADFYKRAEELGVALDYHTGPHGTRLSDASPYKFDNLAWDYPELKLVFEHIGGRPFFEMFFAIISNFQGRVYGGVTSILSKTSNRQWYLGEKKLKEFMEITGSHKFIYGLDFPWNNKEINKRDIEIIQNMDIVAHSKVEILGGNLLKLIEIKEEAADEK